MDSIEEPTLGGIEISEEGTRAVLQLWGEVDASLRAEASAAMVTLLERGGPYVVDVSKVTFIDSSGLAFILQLHRVAADESTHVVLRDPPSLVIDMLDIIGMGGQIPFEFTAGDSADTRATAGV